MSECKFHDEYSLAETADQLGKKALQLGLIHSFVVRYFADSRQYYIPNETESEPLTPEQAYLQFKKMLAATDKSESK